MEVSKKFCRGVYRSSTPEVFLGNGVLKICSKFAGEHRCRSAISIKLLWVGNGLTLPIQRSSPPEVFLGKGVLKICRVNPFPTHVPYYFNAFQYSAAFANNGSLTFNNKVGSKK